jgi:hypothetical protein
MHHLIIEEKSRSRTVQVNKMAYLVSVGSRTSKTFKVEHLLPQTWTSCVSSDTTFTIGWGTATRQKKLIHTKRTIRLWTKAQHLIKQRRESYHQKAIQTFWKAVSTRLIISILHWFKETAKSLRQVLKRWGVTSTWCFRWVRITMMRKTRCSYST